MPMYRRKPVTVEAVQWHQGDSHAAVTTHTNGRSYITTTRGPVQIQHGDWIIRSALGDYYPCPPGLFTLTYESTEVSE